ncbi:MarR family transcriptional regulator [Streptomyces sp. NPDC057682]|uniref:MarR family transcriptional regulator n=1 Tax=Streptomyces sp. NPDC057682 TaxID=3346210 RepID=UPI00367BEA99
MAIQNLSSAPPPPAVPPQPRSVPAPQDVGTEHPKASPGYGKRSVPDERPPHADDFAFLPERERYIAAYVDRLPEGAAMGIKSLAKSQPLYGQMAVGSALRALGVAGHLRQARCAVGEGDNVRWVTRTFWSRTARDNEWWNTFLTAEASHRLAGPPPAPPAATPAAPPPPWVPAETTAPAPESPETAIAAPLVPQQRPPAEGPSPAYLALARLGHADRRVSLSEDDCRTLEAPAAAWFARGADADDLIHAVTAGLPPAVDSPLGFVRKRLVTKLPPHRPAAPAPAPPDSSPGPFLMPECTACRVPGRPEAFCDGLCAACRRPAATPATDEAAAEPPVIDRDVQGHVDRLREQLRLR